MKLKIGDDEYPFDLDSLRISEAKEIKKNTGLTITGFTAGLADLDPDAVQAAIWLAKNRSDVAVDWDSLEEIDLKDFEVIDDEEDEDDEESADPPTADGGTSTSMTNSTGGSSYSPTDGTGAPTSSTD